MRNWKYIIAALLAMCSLVGASIVPSLFRELSQPQPLDLTATIAVDKDTVFFDVDMGGTPWIAKSAISTWNAKPLSVVTDGSHPRLSRIGDWMFFERSNGDSHEIWRRKLSTNDGEELLLHETSRVEIHDVSSDGSKLIIRKDLSSSGLGRIIDFRLFNTNTRKYSAIPLGVGGCFLSDGALVIAPEDGSGLCRRSASGEETQLTTAGAFPIASPDGRRLLYWSNIDAEVSTRQREWEILDLNSGEVRHMGHAGSPVFSGDGDSVIYFDTSPEVKFNRVLRRYDINSGSSRELFNVPGYVAGWTTTPGGTAGVVAGRPSIILLMDPSGKSVRSFFPVMPPTKPIPRTKR